MQTNQTTQTQVAPTTPGTAPKRRSLFDIGDDLIALEQLIESCDGDISDPKVEQAISQWMNELERDLAGKTDGYVNLIRKWEAEGAAAKAEAEQYAKAAEVRINRVKRLKQMLQQWMDTMQRARIETATGRTVAIQNNGGVTPLQVDDAAVDGVIRKAFAEIDAEPGTSDVAEILPYLKARIELDVEKVRKAIAGGIMLSFAKALPRGQHLRIR